MRQKHLRGENGRHRNFKYCTLHWAWRTMPCVEALLCGRGKQSHPDSQCVYTAPLRRLKELSKQTHLDPSAPPALTCYDADEDGGRQCLQDCHVQGRRGGGGRGGRGRGGEEQEVPQPPESCLLHGMSVRGGGSERGREREGGRASVCACCTWRGCAH